MGRVNNGSDVPLLGRVCSERRGAPGKLAGPRCQLAGPPGPCAEGEGGNRLAGPTAGFQPTRL
jgi:hypothetical protein